MKSPSRLPSGTEGGSSQPREETHNLIEPEHEVNSFRETAEAVGKMLHAQAVHNIEMANRRHFGEVGKERSRRMIIYSHDWGVNVEHEHTAQISADAVLLAANCSVPLMRSVSESDLDLAFGPDHNHVQRPGRLR